MANYRATMHLRDLIVKLLHHLKNENIQVLVAQRDIREGIEVVLTADKEELSQEVLNSIEKLRTRYESENVSAIEEIFKEFDIHTNYYYKAEGIKKSKTWVSGYGTGDLRAARYKRP